MTDAIIIFFVSLIFYRTLCHYAGWAPFPLVQVTINNNWDGEREG